MRARMAMPAATKDSQEGKNPNSRFLNFQVLRSADNTDESITILDKGYLHARRSGFFEVRLFCNLEADTADLSPVLLASNGLAGHVDAGPLVYLLDSRSEHTLIKDLVCRIRFALSQQTLQFENLTSQEPILLKEQKRGRALEHSDQSFVKYQQTETL